MIDQFSSFDPSAKENEAPDRKEEQTKSFLAEQGVSPEDIEFLSANDFWTKLSRNMQVGAIEGLKDGIKISARQINSLLVRHASLSDITSAINYQIQMVMNTNPAEAMGETLEGQMQVLRTYYEALKNIGGPGAMFSEKAGIGTLEVRHDISKEAQKQAVEELARLYPSDKVKASSLNKSSIIAAADALKKRIATKTL